MKIKEKLYRKYLALKFSYYIKMESIYTIIGKIRGKTFYYITLSFLFICMLICLLLYFIINDQKINNIFGNAFAGFLTGLILEILSNIKKIELEFYGYKIETYEELYKKLDNVYNMVVDYKINSSDNLEKIHSIYENTINFFEEFKYLESDWYSELDKEFNINNFVKKLSQSLTEIEKNSSTYILDKKEFANLVNVLFEIQIKFLYKLRKLSLDKVKFEDSIL